jgi:hypothetical protein
VEWQLTIVERIDAIGFQILPKRWTGEGAELVHLADVGERRPALIGPNLAVDQVKNGPAHTKAGNRLAGCISRDEP